MILHDSDPDCYLIQPRDIGPDSPHPVVQKYLEALETMLAWARAFLCQPHDRLGRDGAVCPFVGSALEQSLFWMTVYQGPPAMASYEVFLAKYRRWFPALEPTGGEAAAYKVVLALFPDLDPGEAPGTMETIYQATKPAFTSARLALASCYPACAKPGFRRDDFRPFDSPVPFLGFRNLVACDIFAMREREEFVVYLSEFERDLPRRYRPLLEQLAQKFSVPLAAAGVERAGRPDVF